jgi:uncharacterized protein (DUF697 family)
MNPPPAAKPIIKQHVLWAAGVGLLPIPLVDVASVIVIQIDMLNKLAHAYNVTTSISQSKTFLTALTGSTCARLGASLIKAIPVIGTAVGGVSMSVLSGASTYAVGKVAMQLFAQHGTLVTVDLLKAQNLYHEAFEEGKEFVADLKDDLQASHDIFEALEKLRTLQGKGAISDEEFETQKQKLLDRL